MAAPQTWVRDHAKGPGAYKRAPEPEPITVPETAFKAMKMGLQSSAIPIRQTGQNLVNMIRGDKIVGKEERFNRENARKAEIDAALGHGDEESTGGNTGYYGGGGFMGAAKEAAAAFPGKFLGWAPEVIGPKKFAAAYHGLRKLAETGDIKQAAIAAASNKVGEAGEAAIGALATKLSAFAPLAALKKVPTDVPGNAIGSQVESIAGGIVDEAMKDKPAGQKTIPKSQPKPTQYDYVKRPTKKKKDASLASK